jgi:hypothetical protein
MRRSIGIVYCVLAAAASGSTAASSATPQMPDVTVIAPRPPTPEELAGESVHDFVRMHAAPASVTEQLARWSMDICPSTLGLSPAFNAFVSARILAIAAAVGAPHKDPEQCKGKENSFVIFANEPEKTLDMLAKRDPRILGYHYVAQTQDIQTVKRPIQGWYVTVTRGANGGQTIDEVNPLLPLESNMLNKGKHPAGLPGSRLTSYISSSIGHVVIIADLSKVVGQEIGPIADYIAMLALTQAFAPTQCSTLPSIMDLMAPNCDDKQKPSAITAGDIAFLKGLYHANLEDVLTMERGQILEIMRRQFSEPATAVR